MRLTNALGLSAYTRSPMLNASLSSCANAVLDQAVQRVEVVRELILDAVHGFVEQRQVVQVAEHVGKPVGVLRGPAHGARGGQLEQTQLVPQVFAALAPLMHQLRGRRLAGLAHRSPAAAVAAAKPAGDRFPTTALQAQVLDAQHRRLKLLGDPGRHLGLEQGVAGPLALFAQPLTHQVDRRLGDLTGEALRERVESAQQRVCLAGATELVRHRPQARVLPSPIVRGQAGRRNPQQRALLLDRLAGAVHGANGVGVDALLETIDRALELLCSAPPDARGHRLVNFEAVRHAYRLPVGPHGQSAARALGRGGGQLAWRQVHHLCQQLV